MSELKPCPHSGCDGRGILVNDDVECKSMVRCSKCWIRTEWIGRPENAVAAWNRRAQPDNAPLTLEDLRGMDGEPVWVVFDDDSAMCALVDAGNFADELKLTTNWGGQLVLAERKAHIKAIYRRKPEPEGGAR